MLYEFGIIVVAIIVANFVMFGLALALMFNKRFIKWYTKQFVKVVESAQEEGLY